MTISSFWTLNNSAFAARSHVSAFTSQLYLGLEKDLFLTTEYDFCSVITALSVTIELIVKFTLKLCIATTYWVWTLSNWSHCKLLCKLFESSIPKHPSMQQEAINDKQLAQATHTIFWLSLPVYGNHLLANHRLHFREFSLKIWSSMYPNCILALILFYHNTAQ